MPQLNIQHVADLIRQHQLQKWWLAEQLGIDRRTLHRWLSGTTRNIPNSALLALADALRVTPDALTAEVAPPTATAQLRAAKSLLNGRLFDDLMLGHHFAEFENLALGLLVPGMAPADLGRLYLRISQALLRQSKLTEYVHYAGLALAIAEQLDDALLALQARIQLSYHHYVIGDARTCFALDHANLREARRLEQPWQIAASLSNLADQLVDFGRYRRSEMLQRAAIAEYTKLDSKPSLTFCHIGLVRLYCRWRQPAAARIALRDAHNHAATVDFKRGLADCHLRSAHLNSRLGQTKAALAELTQALDEYARLGIQESMNYCLAAEVYRRTGLTERAQKMLQTGLDTANNTGAVIPRAHLLLEQCRLLQDRNPVEAQTNMGELLTEIRSIWRHANYWQYLAELAQEFEQVSAQ